MAWDAVWERIAKEREWGKYPPEELVRWVARNYYKVKDRKRVRFLDVGCGVGAAMWYLAREGFGVAGVDGSKTALDKARRRFQSERLKGEWRLGDLGALPWPDGSFDGVVDCEALSCNSEADTKLILAEIWRVLSVGGRIFSMTFKEGCWGDGLGEKVDGTSYRSIQEGPLAGMGLVRFATLESVKKLYGRWFGDLRIEYVTRTLGGRTKRIEEWVVVGTKLRGKGNSGGEKGGGL